MSLYIVSTLINMANKNSWPRICQQNQGQMTFALNNECTDLFLVDLCFILLRNWHNLINFDKHSTKFNKMIIMRLWSVYLWLADKYTSWMYLVIVNLSCIITEKWDLIKKKTIEQSIYSQTCLKGHLYITNHSLIFPINE